MNRKLHFISQDDDRDDREDELVRMQERAIQSQQNSQDDLEAMAAANVVDLDIVKNEEEQKDSVGRNSFLEKNIVITGSISSVTSLEIEGQVNGNVSCKNDVMVSGMVTGDISAVNVKILSGKVKGNVNCKSAVLLDRDSMVSGNITGEALECDGKVEGNTKLKSKAVITSNAVVHGDIVASQIKIEEGVEIKGKLQISQNSSGYGGTGVDGSEA